MTVVLAVLAILVLTPQAGHALRYLTYMDLFKISNTTYRTLSRVLPAYDWLYENRHALETDDMRHLLDRDAPTVTPEVVEEVLSALEAAYSDIEIAPLDVPPVPEGYPTDRGAAIAFERAIDRALLETETARDAIAEMESVEQILKAYSGQLRQVEKTLRSLAEGNVADRVVWMRFLQYKHLDVLLTSIPRANRTKTKAAQMARRTRTKRAESIQMIRVRIDEAVRRGKNILSFYEPELQAAREARDQRDGALKQAYEAFTRQQAVLKRKSTEAGNKKQQVSGLEARIGLLERSKSSLDNALSNYQSRRRNIQRQRDARPRNYHCGGSAGHKHPFLHRNGSIVYSSGRSDYRGVKFICHTDKSVAARKRWIRQDSDLRNVNRLIKARRQELKTTRAEIKTEKTRLQTAKTELATLKAEIDTLEAAQDTRRTSYIKGFEELLKLNGKVMDLEQRNSEIEEQVFHLEGLRP